MMTMTTMTMMKTKTTLLSMITLTNIISLLELYFMVVRCTAVRHGHWAMSVENMNRLERGERIMVRSMCGVSLRGEQSSDDAWSPGGSECRGRSSEG